MKSTVILPCAGLSTRFPGMRPKWLLTVPDGQLAICRAFQSIHPDDVGRIVIGILAEHDRSYRASQVLRQAFEQDVEVVVLAHRTRGPADTVMQLIELADVQGPLLVKDSDSWFAPALAPRASFIAVRDLRTTPEISRVGHKSFVVLNENGLVIEVIEKSVCSNYFSVGLYGFSNADTFRRGFAALASHGSERELFVSHVISHAIDHGEVVMPHEVDDLVDIGTIAEWERFRKAQSTYLVDIDGVVVRNQSAFFPPFWGTPPDYLENNVTALRSLQSAGAQLIFMTSRPEHFRAATEELLEEAGLAWHALIMGCNHSSRILINDISRTNPYPAAQAVNLFRNEDRLAELLDVPLALDAAPPIPGAKQEKD